jgi:hypothetical protein
MRIPFRPSTQAISLKGFPARSRQPKLGQVLSAAHTPSGNLLHPVKPIHHALPMHLQRLGCFIPVEVQVEEGKKRLPQRREPRIIRSERAKNGLHNLTALSFRPGKQ